MANCKGKQISNLARMARSTAAGIVICTFVLLGYTLRGQLVRLDSAGARAPVDTPPRGVPAGYGYARLSYLLSRAPPTICRRLSAMVDSLAANSKRTAFASRLTAALHNDRLLSQVF